MATCLNSINNNPQYIGLSSNITNRATINTTTNALFLLENELDQSVFFNIKLIGSYSTIMRIHYLYLELLILISKTYHHHLVYLQGVILYVLDRYLVRLF